MTALAAGVVGTVRRHTMAACAIVVLAAAWWWQLAALQEARELVWLAVTAFSVLTGFVALGWLRPTRVGITAPQAMMLLGTLGMLGGLSLDVQRAGGAAAPRVAPGHARRHGCRRARRPRVAAPGASWLPAAVLRALHAERRVLGLDDRRHG